MPVKLFWEKRGHIRWVSRKGRSRIVSAASAGDDSLLLPLSLRTGKDLECY